MMRRLNREDQTEGSALLPAYGRRKLLGYADSFRDLARTYTYMESVNEKENADRPKDWKDKPKIIAEICEATP